jgi:hypothetical protein
VARNNLESVGILIFVPSLQCGTVANVSPGVGRELGSYALEEYTSVKAVHWNFGEKLEWPL